MSRSEALFWAGVVLDVVGLLLVSASEWVPYATDLVRSVSHLIARAGWKIASLFGARRTVTGRASLSVAIGSKARGIVSPSETASLEQKVEFLLRESRRNQERLADLESSVADLPTAWARDIDAVRESLEERIERRLTETQERYPPARRADVVCLVLSIVFLSASNL